MINNLKIYDAYYPLNSKQFIDITILDVEGNIFEGLLKIKELEVKE